MLCSVNMTRQWWQATDPILVHGIGASFRKRWFFEVDDLLQQLLAEFMGEDRKGVDATLVILHSADYCITVLTSLLSKTNQFLELGIQERGLEKKLRDKLNEWINTQNINQKLLQLKNAHSLVKLQHTTRIWILVMKELCVSEENIKI